MGAHRRRLVVAGEQGLIRSGFGQFRRVIISSTCVRVPAVRLIAVRWIRVDWTGVAVIRAGLIRVCLARVLGFAGSEGSSSNFRGIDGSSRTS